jgi:RNA polymerase sigma-70 factor, ECF subfamily
VHDTARLCKEWEVIFSEFAGGAAQLVRTPACHALGGYLLLFFFQSCLDRGQRFLKRGSQDAVQNSLCNAFINLRSFKGQSAFSTWLTRIVINSALMIRRRRTAHVQTSLDEMMDDQPEQLRQRIVYTGPDPEELCATCQLDELLSRHIRQLPPAIRDAFQLYFLKGLSAADTCQTLGIGNSALKARIFRARHILADALRPTMHPGHARKTRSIRQVAVVGRSLERSDTTN